MEILEDIPHPRARPREYRVLALCVAASFAVHAALLVMLPQMSSRDAGHVEVLEVTLAREEPPRALETARPEVREQPREDRKKLRVEKPARETAPTERLKVLADEPAPRELLVMPSKPSASEPAFAVPKTPVEAPRADTPARREVATPAPTAEGAPPEPKTTPPNFNAGYLRNPPPRYPVSARRNGEQGTVTLRVLVTRDGLPANISVQTTSGSQGLDQAAIEAVKGWRFAPARQGTQPVEAWVLVPIVFRLEG